MKTGLKDIPGFLWIIIAIVVIGGGIFILVDFCSIKSKEEVVIKIEDTEIVVPRNYVEIKEYKWDGTTLTIEFKTYDEKMVEHF